MKPIALLLGLTVLLALGMMMYIRLAPSDPARWHADPETIPDPGTPNFARLSADIPLPRAEVAERIATRALKEGAEKLVEDGELTTWIARSRLMRFPDYVTIRLEETAQGTRVTALARARFGRSDMGVNAARLQRWIGVIVP